MKTIAGMIPVLFLIAGSALGCPDFSGKYVDTAGGPPFTIVQKNCDSLTWLSEGTQPWTENVDGKTYTLVDDGIDVITETASWDGSKIVDLIEMKMKDIQPPKDVVMSSHYEFYLEANGDITSVKTEIDNLFGDGRPTTTTHTYKPVQ